MATRISTLIFAFCSTCWAYFLIKTCQETWSVCQSHPDSYLFAWSAAVGALLGLIIWKFFPFFLVLEHELTHFIAALLMFRRPIRLVVDQSGGEIVYEGRGSTIIRLAPYFLPTFSLILLISMPLFVSSVHRSIQIAIGVSWGYHLITGFIEGHPGQSDLRRGGLLASYLCAGSLGGIFYATIAATTIGGWPLVKQWFHQSFNLALSVLTLST
ncbi:MAG: hypothetical protein VX589_14640 [Myxococcota bacterium]|nr:hypothetical protein [Myxococcota bacterium]